MTPFETFFAKEFPRLLDHVQHEDGLFSAPTHRIENVSWDRKAAFLLWKQLRTSAVPAKTTKAAVEDLFGE